jgi:hypothetical protein
MNEMNETHEMNETKPGGALSGRSVGRCHRPRVSRTMNHPSPRRPRNGR